MTATPGQHPIPAAHRSAAALGRARQQAGRHLESLFGGKERTRVIVVLACVLALSSADAATVGAAATPLRRALHISNTDIGLLVTGSSLVAALASLPFGVLADRIRRTRALGLTVGLWGVAMLWSATAGSFDKLLWSRLFLGVVNASAGPIVASMVGDYFPSAERGRIYSYILTGELLGAGLGFAVTGDVAALSWRAAFVILALPTFLLARLVLTLPEPARGGVAPLPREGNPPAGPPEPAVAGPPPPPDPTELLPPLPPLPLPPLPPGDPDPTEETDAQRVARQRGIEADADRVLRDDPGRMGVWSATRYLLGIRTNRILIVASACLYFYLAGLETFGSEFASQQYGVPSAVANLLILLVGVGAVVGVLVGGTLSDGLLRRRFLNSRVVVAGVGAVMTTLLFLPATLTRSTVTAIPYLALAAFGLTVQEAPIDAARLDIVPPLLWGRAEGLRTLLRTSAQALAPVLWGAFSGLLGGGRAGLQWTFVVMLVPLLANGVILLYATRTYPRDVATAAAAT
ncbi:MAG: MFS transporter [Acidimicrobiales bacterium]